MDENIENGEVRGMCKMEQASRRQKLERDFVFKFLKILGKEEIGMEFDKWEMIVKFFESRNAFS